MIRFSTMLFLIFHSAYAQSVSASPISRAAQEDDIREVVLRPQMTPRPEPTQPVAKKPIVIRGKKGGTESKAKPGKPIVIHVPKQVERDHLFSVYFLSVNGKDPSEGLLKRFAGHYPPVKKVSQSYLITDFKEDDSGLWVRDKMTQEVGIRFLLGRIRWQNKSTVTVVSGYFAGGLFAGSSTYTLRRRGKHWGITHIEPGPVS